MRITSTIPRTQEVKGIGGPIEYPKSNPPDSDIEVGNRALVSDRVFYRH